MRTTLLSLTFLTLLVCLSLFTVTTAAFTTAQSCDPNPDCYDDSGCGIGCQCNMIGEEEYACGVADAKSSDDGDDGEIGGSHGCDFGC